ncbi:MAG: TonB-dependent receptor [Salegentibacter sp.]|uniref:TonB-dependent receptor n=1 Tax=Salegentibacter sp. TaxID=1903072 RepID=UPI00286FBF53|nr:TonB-dependent receptor [Salegentibacter sp.]MDR9456541.1 TonB-dependent receptor [Salegentibacter sp.]
MKKFLLFLLVLISAEQVVSQNFEGKVINAATAEPVINARIENPATGTIVFSDDAGNFEIRIEDFPAMLSISGIGFENLEVEILNAEHHGVFYLSPSLENLSEVIITSTAIPGRLQDLPAAVSLVSASDLKRGDNTNLVEKFNNVPGMYVNQGALNTNKINIRGIGARSQYSTNRIQSYFDGIPLTTAEGELTLDDIDPESLDRIEVIKGPTSSVYGAGLGGSVNLFSALPKSLKTEAAFKSQVGSFNTRKNVVRAVHATTNAAIHANYSELTSDGYRDNGEYDRQSAVINARLQTSEENSLSLLATFTKLKAYIPSSLNEDDFLNNPQSANGNWEAARGYESYDRGMLGASYLHNFSENFSNTTSVYLSFRDAYEPRPFDILKEERVSAGARTRFNLELLVFKLPSQVSFGAEYYNEWYNGATFENLFREYEDQGSVMGQRLSGNEQDRNYSNFFGQMNLELSEKWMLEAGFNINSTQYSLNDLYAQDEIDQSGDYRFDLIFSPRVGTTYEVSPGKNFYGTISHGFSTPTVAETLTPEGLINTGLQPETGINYELGFKGNWLENRLYTEFSAYSIRIEDLLVAQRVAEDQYVGLNAGKTIHNGLEFLVNYNLNLTPGISAKPYLNAAFNFFEFDEFVNNDQDFSGNELPGVPKSTLNLGLNLESDLGLDLFAGYRAVGEIPLNDANSGYSEKYQLVNLKASWSFDILRDLGVNFYAGINNVFDEHYAASVLTNAVGFGGAAPRYYYPGNPRNYYGGVQLNYIF